MIDSKRPKISVGISSCLMGEKVRFDSGHKRHAFVNDLLSDYFAFESFCPEMDIGLGAPRETIRLVTENDSVRCVGSKTGNMDVTDRLAESAEKKKDWHASLCGYILKKDSPSCGMERVRLYKGGQPTRTGVGIYAQRLMRNFPNLPIEEEGRLGDARLRENFIQRVYIYSRWRAMEHDGVTLSKLQCFHAQHKYTFMSHDQGKARDLGSLLVSAPTTTIAILADQYLSLMTTILKTIATRKNHSNTLLHIQGYLKRSISSGDKQELLANIDQYRKGVLPLIVPMTLLRHYFRLFPNEYIGQSHYMQPHPSALMLLNAV